MISRCPLSAGMSPARQELYRAGVSLTELADEFGVVQSAIRMQLIKAGVEMRPKHRTPFGHVDTD